MANNKEVIEIEVVSNSADQIKNIKTQLREANAELLKVRDTFGETSIEAINAAKKVAELKDAIGDAKDMANAFQPGGGFQAVAEAGAVAAGGFAAAEGAMALFGAESEDLQKVLVKVQGAMALSQGLSGLANAGDALKNLKAVIVASYTSIVAAKAADTTATEVNTVAENSNLLTKAKNAAATAISTVATGAQTVATTIATGAQWLWNAAMAANPIGAVVAAVAALVAGIYFLVDAMATSSAEAKKNEEMIKKNAAAFDKQKAAAEKSSTALETHNQHQYDLAKASGASAEELRKLSVQHAKEASELAYKNTMLARTTFLRERDTLATLTANGATDEAIKAQKKLTDDTWAEFNKQRDNYYKTKEDIKAIERKNEVEVTQEETNRREKRKEQSKKNGEEDAAKKKKDLDTIAEIQKQANNVVDDLGKTEREKELEAVDDKNKEKLALLKQYGKDTSNLEIEILNEKNNINLKYDDKEREAKRVKDEKEKEDNAKKAKDKLDFMEQFKEQEKEFNDLKTEEEIEALRLANERKLNQQMEDDLKKGAAMGLSEEELQKIRDAYAGKKRENDEAAATAEEDLAKRKTDILFSIAQSGVSMMDSLAQIGLIKGKAAQKAQKALTLAQIGRDTASAISSLVKGSEATGSAAGPGYLPVKIATFTAGLVPILANIAKAKQLLSSDGGGGGSVSPAAAPSISTPPQAPTFNVVGNSGVNQLAQTIAGQGANQQPIQAYVVSGQVTTAQSLDRNRVDNASMG
jgi:hypothetical protein